ncbi:MAG: CDP-alcohol phosphatidyltransferase family protein [Coriobacteriales bacterium]|nr:CDP-alcohol phosphatidyltransferase family protein [Coriobacteriales bacterium]
MNESSKDIDYAIRGLVAPEIAKSQAAGVVTAPLGSSENPSNRVLTVANVITACRFVLTMVFLVLFVRNEEQTRMIALVCYAVAACTDFLDGQVARRTQTVSWVGKIMDPIMDRILLFTGVIGLMAVGELPIWVAVFVVARDAYLAVCAMLLQRYQHRPMDVIYVGKAATALLMTGFVDLLIGLPIIAGLGLVQVAWLPGLNGTPAALGIFCVYAGLVCSFTAAVIYTAKGLRIRSRVIAERREGESR